MSNATAPEFDIIIRNGRVIDGSGRPAFSADVAIKGDRIVDVDGNGALDGVFGVIDDPQGLNNLRYVVAWDISGAGANKGSFAGGVSGVRGFRQVPSATSSDLGMTIAELDGGNVEVIFDVLNANPWGMDEHQYLIGYNANFAGFF